MTYHAFRQRGAYGNRIPGLIDSKAIGSYEKIFSYTGSYETEILPPGSYAIELYGAQGGGSVGGKGGYTYGEITLTENTTVYIFVGQQPTAQIGGWNGGGNSSGSYQQTAGGGATDIRIGGTALTNRILIAAGGGGRGSRDTRANGHGGGLIGTDAESDGSTPGTGGTQSAGGIIGGTLGQGGSNPSAGGGGGGYYGGGAGQSTYAGGGGGSSYYGDVRISNGATTSGQQTGNGSAKIYAI